MEGSNCDASWCRLRATERALHGSGTLLRAVVFLAIKIPLGNNKIGIIYLTSVSGRAVFYFLNTVLFYFGNSCQGYQVNSATYSVPHWNIL